MTFPPTKAKLTVPQTVFLAFFEDGCHACFSSVIGDLPDHDNVSKMTRVAFYNIGPFSWNLQVQLIWFCELEIKRWDEKSLISGLVSVTETALWRSEGLGAMSLPATVTVVNLIDLCCASREL